MRIGAVNRVIKSNLALPFELSGDSRALAAYNDWLEATLFVPMRATQPQSYAAVVEYIKSFILNFWNRDDDGSDA